MTRFEYDCNDGVSQKNLSNGAKMRGRECWENESDSRMLNLKGKSCSLLFGIEIIFGTLIPLHFRHTKVNKI